MRRYSIKQIARSLENARTQPRTTPAAPAPQAPRQPFDGALCILLADRHDEPPRRSAWQRVLDALRLRRPAKDDAG